MVKILNTGDLHLGRNYSKYDSEVGNKYSEARFNALRNLVSEANRMECDYIIITGDVFDTKRVAVGDVNKACNILGTFEKTVVVLPGNHDYYEGKDDDFWNKFKMNMSTNTVLLTENRPCPFEDIVIYPAICGSKHSTDNAIGWIKNYASFDSAKVNIGVAHGSIDGVSPDPKREYFPMSIQELESSNVDLWLIGHTHVPYPNEKAIKNPKILNAGTHQQTDISDNSEGSAFYIEIDENKQIKAERVNTGAIRFIYTEICVEHGSLLENAMSAALSEYLDDAENISVRVNISGTALKSDYDSRESVYEKYKERFIYFEVFESNLKAEITSDMIDSETSIGSVENELLKKYMDEPEILNLAFDLIRKCKEDK